MVHRKNDERIGVSNIDSNFTPIAENVDHPHHGFSTGGNSLNFVSPTEFVELPSKGRFYREGHPLHNNEVIEVKHMTAKEEDILTSQSLLKKGVAIDRLLQSLIVDKRINADDLLISDRNALLINARINGYGPEYNTQVSCPSCQANVRFDFNLEESKIVKDEEEEVSDPSARFDEETGLLMIKLPMTGWVFACKAMTGRDEKLLSEGIETRRKRKLPEDVLSQQINLFTSSINGVTDRIKIFSAIQSLPARDSKHLRATYQKFMPIVDLTQTFECSECGHTADMEVPFTTDFFWPKR